MPEDTFFFFYFESVILQVWSQTWDYSTVIGTFGFNLQKQIKEHQYNFFP